MNILPVPAVVVWAVSVCYISRFRARIRPPEGGFPDARRINPAFLPRILFPTFRRRGSPSPVPGKKIQCGKPPRGFSLGRRRQSRGKERPAASGLRKDRRPNPRASVPCLSLIRRFAPPSPEGRQTARRGRGRRKMPRAFPGFSRARETGPPEAIPIGGGKKERPAGERLAKG